MRERINKVDEDYLRRLDSLEAWLSDDLGMGKYDRIHEAIEVVREHGTKYLALQSGTGQNPALEELLEREPNRILRYLYAVVDVTEFFDIFDAFRSETPDRIAPKLSRALSGPFMPSAETKENADARNIQFELALAAEWRAYGLDVHIGEPDLVLSAGETQFIVECKRPYREHSIRANIRGAKNQLKAKLEEHKNYFGAIAISVTRILVPGSHLFQERSSLRHLRNDGVILPQSLAQEVSNDPRILGPKWAKSVGEKMQDLMERNRWSKFDFHERLVGMFFHAAPPSILGDSLGRIAVSMLAPIGKLGPAFTYLRDVTRAAYQM